MANRSDNFNRANGSVGGSTPSDGGSAWVAVGTPGSVSSNALAQSGSSNSGEYLEASAADVDVQATMSARMGAGSFGSAYLAFRISDAANHWKLQIRDSVSSTLSLTKRVAGTETTIQTAGPLTLAAGDVWKVHAVGGAITVYQNGTTRLTASDTFNQTATKHGFIDTFGDAAVRWDDFSITDLSGGGGGTTYYQNADGGYGF